VKPPVEIWSPLPPLESGIADYVEEQLQTLDRDFALTLVVEAPDRVDEGLRRSYRTVAPEQVSTALRIIRRTPRYTGFAYLEAFETRAWWSC
jgi:hypothetical protein